MAQPQALIVAINAKYVHTSLAARSLRSAAPAGAVELLELTINDVFESMRSKVYLHRRPIVGFCCYIWNMGLVLRLAQALKKMDPGVQILLGGPEVSYDSRQLLEKHPYIDGVIRSEGEGPIRALLGCGGDYGAVPSMTYRDGDGCIRENPLAAPIPLDELPFVYENELENLPAAPQILYYESSRGCPFRCGFCLSGGTGVRFLNEKRTIEELTALAKAGAHQVKLVDRTFNANPGRAARIWRALGQLDVKTNFHFEISAQLLDQEGIEALLAAPAGRFQLEVGVQTTNEETLKAVTRPDKFSRIAEVTRALRGSVHLHLDLIAGLPKEDFVSFGRSFDDVFALRPQMLQLGFLKLLKGSVLRQQAESFGCAYADDPPYEVLGTDVLSPDDLIRLKKVEQAVDRYYHSPELRNSLEYLLKKEESAFGWFLRLGEKLPEKPPLRVGERIRELWIDAREQGKASEELRALLLYDYLKGEKRGNLPECLEIQVSRQDDQKIRLFYRDEAPGLLGLPAGGGAWRHCHVQVFELDIFALLRGESPQRRRCPVFFDYLKGGSREISL